eukprot:CAMPEP_0178519846 /NCGR_PEP_ID=MMETSP0696-20121128/27071_1 /TAXON_ID=265572 /ORGANISM="Extubocellulus spinifer, Strain CCMP396" /LENGTH=581 /DNA_ID=CAMNT_0020150629 /DNA_START=168 /DNA_END=1913 /DNA_ORIENTATION=-
MRFHLLPPLALIACVCLSAPASAQEDAPTSTNGQEDAPTSTGTTMDAPACPARPAPFCTEPLTEETTPDPANPIAPGTLVQGTNGPNAGEMTLEHEAWSTPESRFDYTWPSPEDREAAIANGTFVDYNINIAGIKGYNGRWFMTTPRWKGGVPATVVEYLPKGSDVEGASPDKDLFKPWPSWHWNRYSDGTPEDCNSTIQYTHAALVDIKGRLWVIDNGAADLFVDTGRYVCPPKVMAFDIAECDANPDTCEPVVHYVLPQECARFGGTNTPVTGGGPIQFLNDLAVDPVTDWIYITDANFPTPPNDGLPGSEYTGGVIGLNVELGICNRVSSMETDIVQEAPTGSQFIVNGANIALSQSADGIALDPISDDVVFTSIGAYSTWTMPAAALRDPTLTNDERAAAISRVMVKDDQTDGFTVDPQGNLWMGGMQSSSVRKYVRDEWGYFDPNPEIVFSDCSLGVWFDSFGDDIGGNKIVSASNEITLFFCELFPGAGIPCPPAPDRTFAFRIFSAPITGGTSMDTIMAKADTWTEGWPDYAALAAGEDGIGLASDTTSGSSTHTSFKILAFTGMLALIFMHLH